MVHLTSYDVLVRKSRSKGGGWYLLNSNRNIVGSFGRLLYLLLTFLVNTISSVRHQPKLTKWTILSQECFGTSLNLLNTTWSGIRGNWWSDQSVWLMCSILESGMNVTIGGVGRLPPKSASGPCEIFNWFICDLIFYGRAFAVFDW